MGDSANKKKILIIEDDQSILGMYTMKFTDEGFEVHSAEAGDVGLEKAEQTIPDVILLDIIMPKLDGFNVLKRLKANDNLKNIPVILLTNLGQESDIKKGGEMGAAGYLVKANYTPAQVVEEVNKILNK